MSGLTRLGFIGDQTGRQVGDTIVAAVNPDASSYIACDTAWKVASSYPALIAALGTTGMERYRAEITGANYAGFGGIDNSGLAATSGVVNGKEYFGQEFLSTGDTPKLYVTTDGGKTHSLCAMPTAAAFSAVTGISTANARPINQAVTWDAVSSKWVAVFKFFDDTNGGGATVLCQSTDGTTFTIVGSMGANGGSGGQYNMRFETDSAGGTVLNWGGTTLLRKASGSALNVTTGWTNVQTLSQEFNLRKHNGTLIATTALTTGLYTSTNGTTWTLASTTPAGFSGCVGYDVTWGYLFNSGSISFNQFYTTTNFSTYTLRTLSGYLGTLSNGRPTYDAVTGAVLVITTQGGVMYLNVSMDLGATWKSDPVAYQGDQTFGYSAHIQTSTGTLFGAGGIFRYLDPNYSFKTPYSTTFAGKLFMKVA